MFNQYLPVDGRFDEALEGSGLPRSHWRALVQAMDGLDDRALAERRLDLQRLLQEHGVTYNIYARASKRPRPWALDLLPLPMSSRAWREVEVGVAQRAELMRVLLNDIYGEQRVISRGLIPAELILGHPGFHLPCMGAEKLLERALTVYAADFGRGPDGELWVLADRTQAPSGIGYALEARTITSRVLPSIFRESNVHPVLPFLRALRRSLTRLADDDAAAVAVLTAGSANETYSEHAYLARQMGLPLVDGEDLQVQGGRCWMLTPSGRQPIRALLRRMDDDYAEPLELNRQSILGTPGLLECVRGRSLSMANSLGAGVLENPALGPYLPRVCEMLLGEELKLPSVPSWWCGEPSQHRQVLERFDELLIRDLQRPQAPPQAVAALDAPAQTALKAQIARRPGRFSAQLQKAHSTAPVLTRQGLTPRSIEIRTFAVADGDSFKVMPGGLARSGRSAESWRVSGQSGGVSKDIWVLSSEAQRGAQILPHFLQSRTRRFTLSEPHTADNVLWMARYTTRAELLARLLGCVLKRLQELGPQGPDAVARQLCEAVTWQTTIYPGFLTPEGQAALDDPLAELLQLMQGSASGSLMDSCQKLHQAAGPLRHLLTHEIATQLVRLQDDLQGAQDLSEACRTLDLVQLRLVAITAHLQRSLPDGAVRQLVELGTALETAIGGNRLIRSLLAPPGLATDMGPLVLDLLNTTAALMDGVDIGSQSAVLEVALLAAENPRSVRYQLMRIDAALRALPGVSGDEARLGTDTADKLLAMGAWDVPGLLAAPGGIDPLLRELDVWLRDCALRIEKRYMPVRPARMTQLVPTT